MEKPNVLWILCDELRADALSCYGITSPLVSTPAIDALAARGVLFERAYTSSPVCVPARAAMLTGLSPVTSGVLNNEGWSGRDFASMETFPEVLAEAGWSTSDFGKEHLPGGRTPWQHHDDAGSDMGDTLARASADGVTIHRSPGIGHVYSAVLPEGSTLPASAITDGAAAAIRDAREPFLVRASYLQPHKPMVVPEPWASRYADVEISIDAAPCPTTSAFERRFAEVNRGSEMSAEEIATSFRMYLAAVAWLDDQVATLVAALDDAGAAERTVIVLSTDHGANLGEAGAFGKHTFTPQSHRVPLIISLPGGAHAGERRADLAVSEDLASTVLGLCGVASPTGWDGRDLFSDPAPDRIVSVIGYGETSSRAYPARDVGEIEAGRGWPQRTCVRTVRYRLDCTTRVAGTVARPEDEDVFLADGLRDPSELVNRVEDPAYRHVLDELLHAARTAARAIPVAEPDEAAFALMREHVGPV